MIDSALAWSWSAGGAILLFGAVMAVVGGRRYRNRRRQLADEKLAQTPSFIRAYYRLDDIWRKSTAYLVWMGVFSATSAGLAAYFFWRAWELLR
jgi:membrane protein implicated in regulation of membrane protease activity